MSDIRQTLDERGKRYGEFRTHADISQELQHTLHQHPKWIGMHSFHKEALQMICHKIGRIMNGDESYDDNYRDIAGYAQLVVDILVKGQDAAFKEHVKAQLTSGALQRAIVGPKKPYDLMQGMATRFSPPHPTDADRTGGED